MHALIGLAFVFVAPAAPEFAPHLMLVHQLDLKTGQLHLRVYRAEEQEIQEIMAGGGGTVFKTEKVYGPTRADRYLTLKECKIQDAAGKAIAAADLPKRLAKGAAVVLTNDGKAPPKAYLSLMRPETVIVIGPAVKLDPRIKLPPGDDK